MSINTQIFGFNAAVIVKNEKLFKFFGFNAAVKPEFEKKLKKI